MPHSRDTLYASHIPHIGDFHFNTQVADVFPDMINRSVPGYKSIIASIGLLARERVQADSNCYDLGCSLGAATLTMRQNITHDSCHIIAVDNATAMIDGCRKNIRQDTGTVPVELRCEDVSSTVIENASMVVLNFTLQFIAPGQRSALIQRIYQGMRKNGILLLSEKLAFNDANIQQLQTDLHHAFKRANGYSELEISQKRNALEKVLIPETLDAHRQRLFKAGFISADLWFQCFNFASLVAIK